MSKIFISYRREDSSDATGRIYDYLCAEFNPEYVFKDVDSIPIGEDFKIYIDDKIKKCRVMLVIIGNTWMTALNKNGGIRLQDPKDFVRIEIETAFANKIRVIPVLVGQATLPSPESLPPSLQKLVDINAILIRRDPDFRNDIKKLINDLKKYLNSENYKINLLPILINNKFLSISFVLILIIAFFYTGKVRNIIVEWYAPDKRLLEPDTSKNKNTNIGTDNPRFDSIMINEGTGKPIIYHNIPRAYLTMRGAGVRSSKQHLEATLNEPNMPKFISTHANAQGLNKIIDWLDVENSERYKSSGYQSYCNIYAADYCYLAGVYLPRVWWTSEALSKLASNQHVTPAYFDTVGELNTNAIYSWLKSYGKEFGWRNVMDVDSLQDFANAGKVALVIAKKENSPGHLSIIVPEIDGHMAFRQSNKVTIPLQSYADIRSYKYNPMPEWWTSYNAFSYWVHK